MSADNLGAYGPSPMDALQKIRVLHVEDSADDATIILHELRKRFEVAHRVVATADDLRKSLDEPWDIVLSDFTMPGFSGLEALEIIKENKPEVPFVFVSGTIGEERAVNAIKSGATDFVIKNSLSRLVSVVERVLRESENNLKLRTAEKDAERSRKLSKLLASSTFSSEVGDGAEAAAAGGAGWACAADARASAARASGAFLTSSAPPGRWRRSASCSTGP